MMKRQNKDVWKRTERRRERLKGVYRKLFWKEVSNAKEKNVESCSRVKHGNGRLAQGE